MGVERNLIKPGLKVMVQGIVEIDNEQKMVDAKGEIILGPTHHDDTLVDVKIVSGPYSGKKVQVNPELLSWRKQ